MINSKHLREHIIVPTLKEFLLHDLFFEELLIFTCALETRGGTYLTDKKNFKYGIYGMHLHDYQYVWDSFQKTVKMFPSISALILSYGIIQQPSEDRLIYDLKFATLTAIIFYSFDLGKKYEVNFNNLYDVYNKFFAKNFISRDDAFILYEQFIY